MVVNVHGFFAEVDTIEYFCKSGQREAEVFHVLSTASMCTNHKVFRATLKQGAWSDSTRYLNVLRYLKGREQFGKDQ